MPLVEISSTLDGEATLGAIATAVYSGVATLSGTSNQAAGATAALQGGAALAAEATLVADGIVGSAAELIGAATMGAQPAVAYGATVAMHGDSSTTSAPMYGVQADMGGTSGVTASASLDGQTTCSVEGASSIAANATVSIAAAATVAGVSTLSGTADYVLIQIAAELAGHADFVGDATFLGAYGEDSYGGSPYGGAFPPFGLESATALSSTRVRIRYTAMVSAGFPPLLQVSNYLISPSIVIHSVVLESAQSVLLDVEPLTAAAYTVTISAARGYFGQPLYPQLHSAQFLGVPSEPTFYAVATGKRRVRAVFSEPMQSNAALVDPAQYGLSGLDGVSVPITSVVPEQTSEVRSTVLQLAEDLVDERHYRLTVQSGIVSIALSAPVSPDTSMFQWVDNPLRTQIPVGEFSGEVMGGLYGIHGGLVFFSPALETAAANSVIEVEQVDVCTRAYDEYHLPQPLDPAPLRTHGAGLVLTPTVTTLNSADWVLWAAFPRLVDARFDLSMGTTTVPLEDVVPTPTDEAGASATLVEIWPPGRVSLLNATEWKLFEPDGAFAAIDAAVGGIVTVSGLSGMSPLDVGRILTIRGAATASNNGNFLIVAFIDPGSVQIASAAGVPDANSGALVWTKPGAFITADNLSAFPGPGPSITTVLHLTLSGEATQEAVL